MDPFESHLAAPTIDLVLASLDRPAGAPPLEPYTFIANIERRNRNGFKFVFSGLKLDNYKANPIVLFNHDWNSPIGTTSRIWTEGDRLMHTVAFADTPQAHQVKALVDQGVIKGSSIGVLPIRMDIERGERGMPEGLNVTEGELFEISIVPIPADPATLRVASLERPTATATADEVLSEARALRLELLTSSARR